MNLQNQTHVFVLEDGQAEQIMRMYYYLPKKTIQNCNETLFKISIKNAGNFSLKKKTTPNSHAYHSGDIHNTIEICIQIGHSKTVPTLRFRGYLKNLRAL